MNEEGAEISPNRRGSHVLSFCWRPPTTPLTHMLDYCKSEHEIGGRGWEEEEGSLRVHITWHHCCRQHRHTSGVWDTGLPPLCQLNFGFSEWTECPWGCTRSQPLPFKRSSDGWGQLGADKVKLAQEGLQLTRKRARVHRRLPNRYPLKLFSPL